MCVLRGRSAGAWLPVKAIFCPWLKGPRSGHSCFQLRPLSDPSTARLCVIQRAFIKVKNTLQESLLVPKGPFSGSLLSGVLAKSHLHCFPQHHCIMLNLHQIASAFHLQDWLPTTSPRALFMSLPVPFPSVTLVPICRGLALCHWARRAGRVCGGSGVCCLGRQYATHEERLRCSKNNISKRRWGLDGVHQSEEIPCRRIPAQFFSSLLCTPPPPNRLSASFSPLSFKPPAFIFYLLFNHNTFSAHSHIYQLYWHKNTTHQNQFWSKKYDLAQKISPSFAWCCKWVSACSSLTHFQQTGLVLEHMLRHVSSSSCVGQKAYVQKLEILKPKTQMGKRIKKIQ